jgi:hypothetical protein
MGIISSRRSWSNDVRTGVNLAGVSLGSGFCARAMVAQSASRMTGDRFMARKEEHSPADGNRLIDFGDRSRLWLPPRRRT